MELHNQATALSEFVAVIVRSVLNLIVRLNANEESSDAFRTTWNRKNGVTGMVPMARYFSTTTLRIADAHEAIGETLRTLHSLGFDTANVNQGYGRALDFVMDGVIDGLAAINDAVASFLAR